MVGRVVAPTASVTREGIGPTRRKVVRRAHSDSVLRRRRGTDVITGAAMGRISGSERIQIAVSGTRVHLGRPVGSILASGVATDVETRVYDVGSGSRYSCYRVDEQLAFSPAV